MIEANPLHASALLRLCQLVSPALPVGGYHFSQGLEYAAHAGWVRDETTALEWIRGLACHGVGRLDVPVLLRLHAGWTAADAAAVGRWSRFLVAARETTELRAEDRHLGMSLAKVLADLDVREARDWAHRADSTFAALFALACVRWGIDGASGACAYLWSWCENQVLAAVKIVPLGQSAGQRMLDRLIRAIPDIAANAGSMADEDIGGGAPLHWIASAAHETQYTRLFRS